MSELPVNLDNLINRRTIENHRIEFKATWNEETKVATVRSTCAYANDLSNLNGGYIIIGIEEENGVPVFPLRGLDDLDLDLVQREIMGACRSGIKPDYLPIIFTEYYEDKALIVLWTPAGDNRPYEAPKRNRSGYTYWVRSGSSSIEATGDLKRQLFENAAKIPFDDRRGLNGELSDISGELVRRHLRDIRSFLSETELSSEDLFDRLRLTVRTNSHKTPKNVALLFFTEEPTKFLESAYIEVVQFGDDSGGDLIEEKEFRGNLPDQIRICLNYMNSLGGGTIIEKSASTPESDRTVPYPYEAMREAIVNAVYHRGYDTLSDPVKIYLYPDRMEITSYPGPVPGIEPHHFKADSIPSLPARNRRIGEFLKELRLAERRGTGIPKIHRKMLENGSPNAEFDFDSDRSFFRVTLPVHPRFKTLHTLREASHLWAIGERDKATQTLVRSVKRNPNSGALVGQLIEYAYALDDWEIIKDSWNTYIEQKDTTDAPQALLSMARVLVDSGRKDEAERVIDKIPVDRTLMETVELAILLRRAGDIEGSHRYFSEAYSVNPDDPQIVHEYAQAKRRLASRLDPRDKRKLVIKKRLNREVVELLRRAIQLADRPGRKAWCWYDLARALDWLREPASEVEAAYLKARALLPEETAFQENYEKWMKKYKNSRNQNKRR